MGQVAADELAKWKTSMLNDFEAEKEKLLTTEKPELKSLKSEFEDPVAEELASR